MQTADLPAALRDSANPAEVGHCGLCGQEMIRTADDCWHPHTIAVACPPEDRSDFFLRGRPLFGSPFRPGREHWHPGPPLPPLPRFSEPRTFPSGVRWEPTDYRPIDQTPYLEYAEREARAGTRP